MTDERVPTLEQALGAARGKILVNLHLKDPVTEDVATLVKRMNMVGQVTTWITSVAEDPKFQRSALLDAVGTIPTINDCRLGYPAPCWPDQIHALESFVSERPVAFFLDYRQSHEFISAIAVSPRPPGTRIFVETLNNEDRLSAKQRRVEWSWLIEAGVSMIMTNYPAELIEFLKAPVSSSVSRHDRLVH